MATLLETLKKNLGQVSAPELVTDETGTVQQLLAARKGIVGPATALGPKGFSVAEAAAQQPAQQQMAQLGQSAQLQSTAISQEAAAQAEEQRQREANIAAQRQQSQLQNRIQTENVLRTLEQQRTALSEDKRRAGMEQVAANLRLQNASYIDNLQMEGARSRLQDSIAFDNQLKQQIFTDNIALLTLKLGNRTILDANDREFQKQLAQIDIDTAVAVAKENMSSLATQAGIQGIGQGVTTAIGAAGKFSEQKQEGKFDSSYQNYVNSVQISNQRTGANRAPMNYSAFKEWQQSEP